MSIYPYLGTNVDPLNIKEIHYRGLLEEGETLMAMFDGVLMDERGRRVGGVSLTDFIVLTDQRLITWARGFFNDVVDGIQWKDIDVVEARTWDPLHGRVVLAFRLMASTPRPRRITIKGYKASSAGQTQEERVMINTFDYMPAADVPVLTEMVGWIGDQVVAGVTGEELYAAFADTFPLPDDDPIESLTPATPQPSSQPQPPMLESNDQKRNWLALGKKDEQRPELADNPDSLIAAYELQRSGDPAAYQNAPPPQTSPRAVPTALGQFGFYDISRGMRLLFEGPRRMGTSLNRVNDVLVDTAELIEDLQDPKARRRTISGLRFAMDMQEQQSGLLGAVAPVVRAVLGGGSSGHDDASSHQGEQGGERSSVRRIQVRAAVRQRDAASKAAAADNAAAATAGEPEGVKAEGVVREPSASAAEGGGTPTPVVRSRAKVRRQLSVNQSDEAAAAAPAAPATSSSPADANGSTQEQDEQTPGGRVGVEGPIKVVSRARVAKKEETTTPENTDDEQQ